jgi:hypothetical protein
MRKFGIFHSYVTRCPKHGSIKPTETGDQAKGGYLGCLFLFYLLVEQACSTMDIQVFFMTTWGYQPIIKVT